MNDNCTRRQLIAATSVALASALALPASAFREPSPLTAGEDLMQEHGVFGRILLIYQTIADDFQRGQTRHVDNLLSATKLIVDYIEGHHERIEELLVFPELTKGDKHGDLVATLVHQHQVGKDITTMIQKRFVSKKVSRSNLTDTARSMRAYAAMFRPHALREDTVVYPAIRESMTANQYAEFSGRVRELEDKMVHVGDLQQLVKQVSEIEIALGIHDLSKFTAVIA